MCWRLMKGRGEIVVVNITVIVIVVVVVVVVIIIIIIMIVVVIIIIVTILVIIMIIIMMFISIIHSSHVLRAANSVFESDVSVHHHAVLVNIPASNVTIYHCSNIL